MASSAAPAILATVEAMLDEPSLGARSLVAGDHRAALPISWISSSDLADPTPYLVPDQVVLTTGRQFAGEEVDAARYVRALADAGVLAIGFGSEVFLPEPPQALIDACVAAGLPLVEVPLSTPFLAVIRWSAERARSRERWAFEAHRALAAAATATDGTAAVVAKLASLLGGGVTLLDAAGRPLLASQSPASDTARDRARAALRHGRRASAIDSSPEGSSLVHTLGGAGRLHGALAVSVAGSLDAPAQHVVAIAAALLELALGTSLAARDRVATLEGAIAATALAGDVHAAGLVLRRAGGALPAAPVVVVCTATAPDHAAASAAAAVPGALWHGAAEGHRFVVAATDVDALDAALAELDVPRGRSAPAPWDAIDRALAQARTALRRAERSGAAAATYDATSDGVLGLLDEVAVRDAAAARLGHALASSDADHRLALVRLWFSHECSWDAAARAAGMHRHSLRARVRDFAAAAGLDVDRFADRAALWAMVTALPEAGDSTDA